jgi:hypothetical protein
VARLDCSLGLETSASAHPLVSAPVTEGALAAAISPSRTQNGQARHFIARVLAWPQEGDEPAYGNLHWTSKRDGYDRPFWNGRACGDVEDFVSTLDWVFGQPDVQDIYFCTSTQRTCEERVSQKGFSYRNAIRNQQNAAKLKALFIDLDFKAYEGGEAEATTALLGFIKAIDLPRPTAIVSSGGGLHVYWTLMEALTPDEWTPLAYALAEATKQHGLKCDTQCTIDSARILRVPGTLNRKYDPPVFVQLGAKMLDFDYANERIEQALEPYKGTAPAPTKPAFDLPVRPPLQVADELAAGIETGAPLVDLDEVAKECAFIDHALTFKCKGYTNPLWNLTTLIATFTKGERADAHRMASGHADYTPESTDELYDRKLREKNEKGLGWPQCKTISATGCTLCQSCPHFAKGKSPLNFSKRTSLSSTEAHLPEEEVLYVPGNEEVCRRALDRVVAADPNTFMLGDMLVILRVPDQKTQLPGWNDDLPASTPALAADVVERAEKLKWMVPAGGRGEPRTKRRKPPRDFCSDYLVQRRSRYGARPLVGIARVPFMPMDGSINTECGYDPQTGIYHDRLPTLLLPSSPTLDDAKAAMETLLRPFEHYRFQDGDTGPSLVLAANFTALQRPFMATAPMFVVKGSQAGTGKGQMARAIARLTIDAAPPFMTWGHDDDEFKKRFEALLMASPAMLVIDNANGRLLRGDTLETILSEGTVTLRPLGRSEAITLRSRAFLMANGNNISVSGDMSRRALAISILPRSENPERDTFPFAPEEYAKKHREALLCAAYTIMRAWRLTGMPKSGLPAVGSFPEWERLVRDMVHWLTGYDVTEEFERNKQEDPHRQNDAALLAALRDRYGSAWFKASDLDEALRAAGDRRRAASPVKLTGAAPTKSTELLAEDALLDAAVQVFGAKPMNAKSIGHWAKGIENAITDGLVLLRKFDKRLKVNQFRVEGR